MLLEKNNIKSFNEDLIINFEPIDHRYVYKDRIISGATTFSKRYIEEFDSEEVADRCEVNWQIPKETIEKAWQLSGDISRGFGTAIHEAIEYELLYRRNLKKNGERCFNIKHPIIKAIVKDFFIYAKTLGLRGKSFPEALVSDVENDVCALVDNLIVTDQVRKECVLVDYKVNVNFSQNGTTYFKNLPQEITLPTSKLSKLALQLRIQEQMLEKSGWTVIRKIGIVLQDEWKHYEVKDLKGFDMLNGTYKL